MLHKHKKKAPPVGVGCGAENNVLHVTDCAHSVIDPLSFLVGDVRMEENLLQAILGGIAFALGASFHRFD